MLGLGNHSETLRIDEEEMNMREFSQGIFQRCGSVLCLLLCLGFCLSVSSLSNASATANHATVHLVPSAEAIENLAETLGRVKNTSNLPVLFPANVPAPRQNPLFAMQVQAQGPGRYWEIAVTTGPQCQTHGCIIGSVSAQKEGKLEKQYVHSLSPEPTYALKQKVKLKGNVIGYFTPGHAEADWHPPTIEWRMDNVLYILSWEMKENSKQSLVIMANSAIEGSSTP